MFYKLIDDYLHAGPIVTFPDGTLLHLDHMDEVELPYDGWYYFATEEEAKSFFNIE